MKKVFFLAVFMFMFFFSASCEKSLPLQSVKESRFLLDTIVEITIYEQKEDTQQTLKDLFEQIEAYEKKFSRYLPDSEITNINSHPGRSVIVSADTIHMMESALFFSSISDGLFDVSIGPLMDLWNFNGDEPKVPSVEEIQSILNKVDYHKINMNKQNNTISVAEEGAMLDVGAIAKGYITDNLVQSLQENNIHSALLNLGGNLYLHGNKPDGSLWNIGIRNPYGLQGASIGTVKVKDLSVVTSGIYERYFEIGQKRYHHIINPKTGYPEDNTLASVSILSPSSTLADGLSTAVFLLGREGGMALVEQLEHVEAILVTKDKKIYLSSGFHNGEIPFDLTNQRFVIER